MATKIDFDEPLTVYRLHADGIGCDTRVLHSQKEYNDLTNEKSTKYEPGWTATVPLLEYPRWLYNDVGETKSVKNPDEEQAAAKLGFGRKVVPPGGFPKKAKAVEPPDEEAPDAPSIPRRGRPRKAETVKAE